MLNYSIDLVINHKTKEFSFLCDVKLDDFTEEIDFIIYQGVQIESITSGNISLEYNEFDFDEIQFFPESKKITISGMKSHDLKIQYKCKLESIAYDINSINDNWIELNMYSPWYPVRIDVPSANFDIRISGLEDFQVIQGNKTDGIWQLKFIDQVDAYIIGFKDFKHNELRDKSTDISIYSLKSSNMSLPVELDGLLRDIYSFYTDLFGIGEARLKMNVAVMDRLSGGGYFRDDLIVLSSEERSELDWIHFFAHEMAHKWWRGADTTSWEDWLNESTAEFSSWLFLDKHFGKSIVEEVAFEHDNEIRICPPLRNLERDTKHVYFSRFKGARILKGIDEQYGRDELIQCMKILLELPDRKTDLWIAEVTKVGKTDLSNYLSKQLEL
jgi:hypothetical protein